MGFNIGKALKKVAGTVGDVFTAGAYSHFTGGDSYMNDLSSKVLGKDYMSTMMSLGSSSAGAGSNGLASGAIGLGTDILSGWWNSQQQKSLNKEAFNQNLKMWNMQNAYNDPVAQMQRLQNAGLNPNLVYGGGNVTGNTTSNYPTMEPVKYSGIGQGYQQFLNRSQQKEIALANLDLGMREFQQRVTNQGIQNYIAVEKLKMYEKINRAMLGMYGENIKGKQIENRFNEKPFENINTGKGWEFGLKLLGHVLNALPRF